METREKKTETTTHEVIVKRDCDICKKPMPLQPRPYISAVELKESSFDEDGGGTSSEFDICGDCWKSAVLPWMATFGAVPRNSDW